MSRRPWLSAALVLAAAGAASVAAAQAPGQAPQIGWWRMEGGAAGTGGGAGLWLVFNPGDDVQLMVGTLTLGAYRVRGDRVELLDSAGVPSRDVRLRIRADDEMELLGPGGDRLPMRRIDLIWLGRIGPAPEGMWHVRPRPDARPIEVQMTAGGCYRLRGTVRHDRGRWAVDGDSVRVTIADGRSRRALAAAVRGDTLEFSGDGLPGRRFRRADADGTLLEHDRRCEAPRG